MSEEIPDDLMRPREVAALLGVTVGAIYRWAVTGRLPHYQIGGCRRFSRADVVAFVQRFEGQKPVPKPPRRDDMAAARRHGLERYL